ncbi:Glycosyl transferase family 2 [Sphingobium yanoikuyae]|uniref:Glycosyl transferase family 2 n=1 Tax=Sphingobium yanoikuyae TaxID=13690 RepID=A0A084EBE9_SPHYA|nr:glycosyltransferase family A protein [Sphingobium yanoikuyae]KEZ15291.1 Glycosyl transferase family 2 [Sphingobium yanoikuyae]
MSSSTLVSVIIPAYNAANWIRETLASVAAQTHQALEVIVVDDGSTDETMAIATEFATHDRRFQTVRQDNAGVAVARNHGAALARADLLAFVDADDLWAPEKIERQVEALHAAGIDTGLCYSWYVMIDAEGTITYREDFAHIDGRVLEQLFRANFVGNGSSALVRRQAFDDAGGFEPALRNSGAQGCEDILFYCRVAERHCFAVVPEYHVGYRQLPDNMSSDLSRMLRSWFMVVTEMLQRHPEKRAILMAGTYSYARFCTRRAVHRRRPGTWVALLALLAQRFPSMAVRMAAVETPRVFMEQLRYRFRSTPASAPQPHPASPDDRYAPGGRY